MKYQLLAAALAAPVVLAAPTKRQSANIDTTVLQFALTLEHLENVFYKGALQKFSAADFQKAGYGPNYYNNIKYIAGDEQSHVQFLETALKAAGQTPTAACVYNFPYTDVNSFVTLSSVLEGVGTSAYLGGAPLITNRDYLTAAGSILVTEALHTSLQRSAVNEIPFANAYGTPLDPTSVYTLATAFIKSCPATNPTFPFTPFPALALSTTAGTCEQADCNPQVFEKRDSWGNAPTTGGSTPAAGTKNQAALKIGQSATFTAKGAIPSGSFVTFVSGLSVVSVPATGSGNSTTVAIPSAAMGQTYVFITKTAAGAKFDGTQVLFGPAILEVAPAAPSIDYSQS